MIDSGLLL